MTELKTIKPLDGLRAIAILMVLVWHYLTNAIDPTLFGGSARLFQQLTSMTWSGVDLFFVLSGFLIGRILMAHRGSSNYFAAFYLRRSLRIFPPYYLVLLLVALLGLSPLSERLPWLMTDLKPAWSYWLYVQNFMMGDGFGGHALGVTWSLAVEEQFYLLLPLLVWWIRPAWLPAALVLGIVTAPCWRYWLGLHDQFSAYVLLPARMDALLAGALVAWLSLRGVFDHPAAPIARWTVGTIVGGIALALVARFGLGQGPGGVLLQSALVLTYAGVLAGTLYWHRSRLLNGLLANAPARWLAAISYTVYLTHQLFNGLAHGLWLQQAPQIHSATDAIVTVCALAMTLSFSWLSFRLFEKPIIRFGQRWGYRQA